MSFRSLLEKDERVTLGAEALDEAFSPRPVPAQHRAVFDALDAVTLTDELRGMPLVYRGKVRDLYDAGDGPTPHGGLRPPAAPSTW